MEKSESMALDVVRCLMNYMIVMLHAWAAFQYVQWDTVEYLTWTFICQHLMWLAIPTFFLISGCLLFQHFSVAAWPNKMWRRVKRLLVPYLAWNIFFVGFYLALARFVPRLATRVASFGLDSVGGAISKIVSLTIAPIDGPLWFIRVLFLLALVSPILWWLMRFGRGVILLGMALGWCVGETLLGFQGPLRLTFPAYAVACFIIGGILAYGGKTPIAFFRSGWWVLIGILACVLRAYLLIPCMGGRQALTILPSILVTLLAIVEAPALLALASRMPVERIAANSMFGFMKGMSFFAYAGHFLFCSLWLHLMAPLFASWSVGKMSALILIFVGCGIPTMVVVYILGHKVSPRLIKLFDGSL